MNKKDKVMAIRPLFDAEYPDAECSLTYADPHQLLVAVQLSAQCTDARVNIVTVDLFQKYKNVQEFANADLGELMELVRPCGFYRNKAKNIIASSRDIVEKFGGKVPDTMEDLTSLAGVGRKTANLILGDVYGKPAVVVDTHCIRLSNRIGLTREQDPVKIEFALKKIIPPDYQSRFCHQLVLHGRKYCNARKPDCEACPIAQLCNFANGAAKTSKKAQKKA